MRPSRPASTQVSPLIPTFLASAFPQNIRDRGKRYLNEGRVRLDHVDDEGLHATVQGSELYDVSIAPNGRGGATLLCTCPYARDGILCKHIWGTLLEADRRGVLAGAIAATDDHLRHGSRRRGSPLEPERGWRQRLRQLGERLSIDADTIAEALPAEWPTGRRLVYVVDATASLARNDLVVELCTERRLRNGRWDRPRQFSLGVDRLHRAPDARDRQIAQMLLGAHPESGHADFSVSRSYTLPESAYDTTLRLMCETGRCRLRRAPEDQDPEPLAWDDGEPWVLHLAVRRATHGAAHRVEGLLRRGDESMELATPTLIMSAGLLFADGKVAPLVHGGAFPFIAELRANGPLTLTAADLPALLEALYSLPLLPPVELSDELGITEVRERPVPCLTVGSPPPRAGAAPRLPLSVSFLYGEVEVEAERVERALFDRSDRRVLLRDLTVEEQALARLRELGARQRPDHGPRGQQLTLAPTQLDRAVRALTAEGWRVEAEGRLYRQPGSTRSSVSSGIDWFDLTTTVNYGDQAVSLPRLLAALRRGEHTVVLDDGSLGILPEEWLRRYAPLAGTGRREGDDALRFTLSQVTLLDAMLDTMSDVEVDAGFERARAALHDFERITPACAPPGFDGTLRPYQREGLGWMHFLRRFGLGGCLADDMGLGKTIQVLALLESRRAEGSGPSLVVVPRSLVFNWQQEAARFTPGLRLLDHTGLQRRQDTLSGSDHDVVITTYGTMRRDIAQLRKVEFDYVILDEAQAIKNASTASAKAARLLRGRNRLVMSGTPVENRLEELWSLFEFLNPGMLGSGKLIASIGAAGDADNAEARRNLARGLRPFILRRTKAQVANDLPEKQEQTLFVELEPRQRKLYDELRNHYRTSLLGQVDRVGIKRSKIQILEALLRLRQAACHPALIDPRRAQEASGKLDALLPMVEEAVGEGHKVLVFSQFTTLLALVRQRLDASGLTYEYLDGRTRDRQARVERFQNDPACPVFLISLRAGGQGLNLTAADYVFLLDPWWNPAVESQAIDRAHRIGQERRVLAMRLIARDTVEERVLELQQSKRALADAIITADNSVIGNIEREELELLLG